MGISLEQYRAAVGTFYRLPLTCGVYDGGLQRDPPGVEELLMPEPLHVLKVTRRAAALALLLMALSPACLGSLLLIGGVESNPGPPTGDSKKSVLAALCTGAPTTEIRNCLRCYDISRSTSLIEKKMGGISVPNLVATMTYLGVPGQECYVKPAIIRNLVCRIENLLPDTCFICESEYTIAKDEVPLLTCALCGQGIHSPCLLQLLEVPPEQQDSFGPEEVQKKINPCNLPGFFYICHCCEKDKIPSDDDGKKKTHSDRNDNVNHSSTSGATHSIQRENGEAADDSDVNASEDVSLENENSTEIDDLIHNERSVLGQHGQTNQHRLQQHNASAGNLRINPRQNPQRDNGVARHAAEVDRQHVCAFYRKETCRFGISGKGCSRSHPKPCRKFMQHGSRSPRGCSEGSNCTKFHPKICSSSLNRGECFKENCTFPHIKGTRRSNTPETRSQGRRQFDPRPETCNTMIETNTTHYREDFLSALAVLKMELMDSFERRLETLQAQIQQVGTADTTQFYPQTHRYPQRSVLQQNRQIPMY